MSARNGLEVSDRVLLLGSRGFLGQRFLLVYPGAATPDVDIADPGAVKRVLDELAPQVVINCAGKTGRPNVDWCEEHRAETLRSNVTGPLVVLEECSKRNLYLVHLSSGCIYEGDNEGRGFSEEDPPNYHGSYYSRTKGWADQILREFPVLTLRLRMPFDGSLSGRNLIMKLRNYQRVLVEPNSLTHLPDFVDAARQLISRRETGVFNVVNPGAVSPFAIMARYRELIDPGHAFEPLAQEELAQVARAGRSNCILSTEKLRRVGLQLPPVQEAIDQALHEMASRLGARPASHR